MIREVVGETMKVYTKTGDKGQTSLIGGKRVSKDHLRVSAYGTLDEVNAFVGVAIEVLADYELLQDELQHIQHLIFDCGTDLATVDASRPYQVTEAAVLWLEEKIDAYQAQLPPLKAFILPGGSFASAHLHVARTATRRAEREIVTLTQTEEINPNVSQCVNRLSDYFFVIARLVNVNQGVSDSLYEVKVK